MTDQPISKTRRWLATAVVLGWAVAFFGSFAAFLLTPARDFGLAAGWNKVGVFMNWQALASVLALATCAVCREMPRGSALRRIRFVPLAAIGLLGAGIAGLVIWGNMQRTPADPGPGPGQPKPPVTAPANG